MTVNKLPCKILGHKIIPNTVEVDKLTMFGDKLCRVSWTCARCGEKYCILTSRFKEKK